MLVNLVPFERGAKVDRNRLVLASIDTSGPCQDFKV